MALTQTQVSQLYVAIFNRASEGEGNTFWQTSQNTADAANDMLATQDAKDYFGTSLDSNQAFIEHIYLNTLNKTYADDKDGIDFWVNALNSGMSRGDVVASLVAAVADYSSSTDPVTKAAYDQFNNRVEVSNYTADTLEKAPADYKTSTAFATSGTTGLVVTDNTSTVTTAKTSVDALTIDGETFTLTTSTKGDILTGTEKSDLFNATTLNSLQNDDVLLDTTTTDSDILNATVTTNGVSARIQNVETINVTGEYVTTGLDLTNVSGTKTLNLDTKLAGGTATVTAANSINAAAIKAGANISKLDIASLASGTRDTVTVDGGNADVKLTGSGGADKYSVTIAKDKTLTANTMNTLGDELTVSASNNFTLNTNAAIATATINNTGSAAITVTTGTIKTADKLALSGNDIVIKDTTATAATVTGVEVTSTATKSTIELSNANIGAAGALNKAQVSEVLISGAGTTSIKVNESTKLVLAKNQAGAGLTVNIDNASTTAGQDMNTLGKTGTLLLDVNATQGAGITTGSEIDTLFVTAGALKADANGNDQTVTLASITVNGATDTVVFAGSNDAILTSFVATDGDEQIIATSMTGDLTITDISGADTKVYTGSGDDTIGDGTGAATVALTINSGAGNDTINLTGYKASTVTAGSGDDTITTSGKGDTIDAGSGDDEVILTANAATSDTVTLGAGADTVTMDLVANNSGHTIKDFEKGVDTLVLTGTGAGALDLTKLNVTTNTYTVATGITINLTNNTAKDLSDSIQLGNSTTAYTAASNVDVKAGSKDDVIAVDGTNNITTGAGEDTIVVATTQKTAVVSDFTVGSDKVVLTGAAGATQTVIDLTGVTVASGKLTLSTNHEITLNNGANAVLKNGTTDQDVTTMVQLGQDGAAFVANAATTAITGGIFDDYIDLGVTGNAATVNFINNGGMDTIKTFVTTEDKLAFGAIDGIVAGQSGKAISKATKATSGDVYVMNADTSINGDTIDYSKLTQTINNEEVTLTSASVMEDVAGYLNNALTDVKANHTYVAVINNGNGTDAYAYLINATSDTITVDDIQLIGTIAANGDLVAGDIA